MITDRDAVRATDERDVLRGRSLLLGFTGLIPLVLMVPILLLHLYAVGIIEGLVAGAGVIGYHSGRRQGITSVDLLAVGFSAISGVLYFGFGSEALIKHLDVAIYSLLATLVLLSLARQQPWTAQFAKRLVPPDLWDRPAFHTINMRITTLWAAAFALCDLLALFGSGPVHTYAPIAVLIATAVIVPRLARWYRGRVLAAGQADEALVPASPPAPAMGVGGPRAPAVGLGGPRAPAVGAGGPASACPSPGALGPPR